MVYTSSSTSASKQKRESFVQQRVRKRHVCICVCVCVSVFGFLYNSKNMITKFTRVLHNTNDEPNAKKQTASLAHSQLEQDWAQM